MAAESLGRGWRRIPPSTTSPCAVDCFWRVHGPRSSSSVQGRETRPDREGNDGPIPHLRAETDHHSREEPGRYTLGPAIVKGSFVEGMDGRSYLGKRLVAIAPAVTVEVREVPQPRPPTFCGGIGGYRAAVSASPTTPAGRRSPDAQCRGHPFSGEWVVRPCLCAGPLGQSQLAADFEIVDRNPTGRVLGESKRFDYALRHRKAGVSVPAITVTVFDPETESLSKRSPARYRSTVAEATRIGRGGPGGKRTGNQPDGKSGPRNRESTRTSPTPGNCPTRAFPRRLLALAAGGWLAAAGGIAWITRRRRLSGDLVGRRRRSEALRSAERRLGECPDGARGGRGAATPWRTARMAILGLIADSRNLVAEGMTASDAERPGTGPIPPPEQRPPADSPVAGSDGGGGIRRRGPGRGVHRWGLQTIERHLPGAGPGTRTGIVTHETASAGTGHSVGREIHRSGSTPWNPDPGNGLSCRPWRSLMRRNRRRSTASPRRSLNRFFHDGYRNGAVFYNLGNAWFRAGEYRSGDRRVSQGETVSAPGTHISMPI